MQFPWDLSGTTFIQKYFGLPIQDGVTDYLKKMIKEGKEIRWTFDNFDFNILTNIVISGYKNSDMHWICQYITFDRIPSSHLDDSKPLVDDISKFENKKHLHVVQM